jgi:hypothetical protein
MFLPHHFGEQTVDMIGRDHGWGLVPRVETDV